MTINNRTIIVKILLGLAAVIGIYYFTMGRPASTEQGMTHGTTTSGKPYKAKITGLTRMSSLSGTAELTVYDDKNRLIAKKDGLDFDWSLQELHTVKPSTTSLDDLLFFYRSAGAHGYALSVFRVSDDSLDYVTCDSSQKENPYGQSGGDGGTPKFEQLVNDFDGDGNLEIKSINRDWEANASRSGEATKYTEDIVFKWNGTCFDKLPQFTQQSCTDGSECSTSGWCVNKQCSQYRVTPYNVGDYQALNVTIHNQEYPISGMVTDTVANVYLPNLRESDPAMLWLRERLCIPYENQNMEKAGLVPVRCVVNSR